MMGFSQHLLILPILLPMAAGAILLLIEERRHGVKAGINIVATALLLVLACGLLRLADTGDAAGDAMTHTYRLGDWAPPFGIVLVLDRLSALMLMLASVLAAAALVFSLARWHKAGPHFHTLFQFLLMGVNGAFLTGDLFNLFVFFEVLLAASYGLMLHGSGTFRVRAGLHYIAINLAASLLFLIGVSLIYGVTGTLNMADLATRIPDVAAENQALLAAGAAILGIAFLVKAGMWPLCFWLPSAYMAASAPAAALFTILSKVGFYVLLRLTLLLFGEGAGPLAGLGSQVLLIGGMATIAFGAFGVLASQSLGRLAGYSILVSSGTLLAAVGLGDQAVVSGAMFYVVTSTLTVSALFLMIELVERAQEPGANLLTVTMEAYGDDIEPEAEDEEEVGVALPGALAILGICFGCIGLLLAGLPPLSGFIGKFALINAIFNPDGLGSATGGPDSIGWILTALLILSGLAALLAMMRTGIRTFWAPLEVIVPRVLVVEIVPIILLIGLCFLLTIQAGAVMRYTDDAAQALHEPRSYIEGVLPGSAQTGGVSTP
ncbi:cation:proton antiporter [Aminobacter sp. DSM 101952]|uniref:monovalent cation/H+ antiporter subunit D n=1 Tax=Aminobacter sp. DSM 101952 TaxID=2735891 RepID=UPI0006FAE24D|nr:monovalent cation/H+ antiporter subunit D [Aminobacter sp. DSM 101952]KQU65858.1 cation:proton antiporter [Aminobacter sp. DSM 101952]